MKSSIPVINVWWAREYNNHLYVCCGRIHMVDRLGFTMYAPTAKDRQENDVLVTRHPHRVGVSSEYKREFCGCPFDTELRPMPFEEGSDAYHAPRSSDEVLLEISTGRQDRGVEEYIGFLRDTTRRHRVRTGSERSSGYLDTAITPSSQKMLRGMLGRAATTC